MSSVLNKAVAALARQRALDGAAGALQRAVSGAFSAGGAGGRRVRDALNGVWLGHPLHPVLTDLPIGFWTSACLFDALDGLAGQTQLRSAADAAVGAGIVSATVTAWSGLADWQFTSDEPRRVGLLHALLNSGALLLCIWSWALRRRGARGAGRGVFLGGVGLATVSAYLGGDLINRYGIGVDHADDRDAPSDFVAVANEGDLLDGRPRCVEANGLAVMLVRQDDQVYALVNSCAHLGGPLAEGSLDDGAITCPWHGSRFALADGGVLAGPSTFPQPSLDVRVQDGRVEVRRRP